jgi:hypothetical protein
MITNTGGSAFPNGTGWNHNGDWVGGGDEGMSLRDYFAAKAMQGITTTLDQTDGEPYWNVIATDAYQMADAMLKAREQ